MRIADLVLCTSLAASLGCARTMTIGKDPKADPPAGKPADPKRYRVSLPKDNAIYDPLFYDMLNALDAGVGYEMLIIPAPLYETPTALRWMNAPDKTAVDDLCRATPSETQDPAWGAFKIELSIDYAKSFWNSKSPINETRLYKVFLHCIGHALGFEDSAGDIDNVMSSVLQDTADIPGFYARVRALNHPAP